jgi:GntR family transcriptional regulator
LRVRDGLALWAQVLTDLRRRVSAGEFSNGFPSDEELGHQYQVSRATVRTAVGELESAGIVQRHQGKRSTVSRASEEEPLRGRYLLTRQSGAEGSPETSDILRCELVQASEAALLLGLRAEAKLVFVERRRLFAGIPLVLHRSWFPTDLASRLVGADLRQEPLYELLYRLCGVEVVSGWERLAAAVPSELERRQLGISESTGVLRAERLALSVSRPAEYRVSLLRGDRYGLVADWLPADSPWRRHP